MNWCRESPVGDFGTLTESRGVCSICGGGATGRAYFPGDLRFAGQSEAILGIDVTRSWRVGSGRLDDANRGKAFENVRVIPPPAAADPFKFKRLLQLDVKV